MRTGNILANPVQLANSSHILSSAVHVALENFGEQCYQEYVEHMCQIYCLSEDQLFSDVPLVERSMKVVFGFGSEFVIRSIKKNLAEHLPSCRLDASLHNIMTQIQLNEMVSRGK